MRIEVDDIRTPDDNWIINKTNIHVIIACHEIRGDFTIKLQPKETKRITHDVDANAYLAEDEYSYNDLKYEIGKRQIWEVRKKGFLASLFNKEKDNLILVKTAKQPDHSLMK